ncbi:ferredoxin-fold anticodon-binding domain-containing protein 1 [Oryzias latipes]|uniref:ferredoxin-fold anticodon-binding domain-containing protein 1 n=1 Tax=Oryzias latipes TaxID=8090 RepID=UPI0002A4C1C1|nr:ferredoxin-fold anticodon-binding domain-containing protein 1 [Oryzias latipes]
MSHSRTVLLVGEGNFSFSASLCWMGKVTATCPQRQEEVLLFEGAASNISSITDSGGSVLFEVDCTRLAECPALRGRLFDRVLFNFPHCGRKSGVKKNKELLRNFFLSCVQVLTKDGEVHVSLCNGQGGTPADEPRREWHNSWQVVAMAAEAGLILSAVYPFDSSSPQGYKCTGYRSQDKGFRVEKALLHVFTRSQAYAFPVRVEVEEVVEGEKIHYSAPAELSDFLFRKFLCLDSVHPVKLVQDFLLEGLREKWPVSMTTESIPYFIPAKRLQASSCGVDISQCYWVLPKDFRFGDDVGSLHTLTHLWSVSSTKEDRAKSKRAENFWSASLDLEVDLDFYVLRPSLLPYAEELLVTKQDRKKDVGPQRKSEEADKRAGLEGNEFSEGLQDAPGTLYGVSEVVFRNVPISLWGLPAFHELVLRGVFPSECEPVKQLGHQLESLLAPFDVSITTEGEVLHLTAQPMGILGKVFATHSADTDKPIGVNVSLNLDLLALLLFSLPDWRLLWTHDQRFLKQFSSRPPPGTPCRPLSLFPEPIRFDISFWTGPTWDEKRFHAAVREACLGSVELVKLIDTFSHPDLSQTSYCYRLTYHSHTHALSHTQALHFHKQLESLLSSRLNVTIR